MIRLLLIVLAFGVGCAPPVPLLAEFARAWVEHVAAGIQRHPIRSFDLNRVGIPDRRLFVEVVELRPGPWGWVLEGDLAAR